jgi:hypothetical protein
MSDLLRPTPKRGRIQELTDTAVQGRTEPVDSSQKKDPLESNYNTVSGASGEALRRELQSSLLKQKKITHTHSAENLSSLSQHSNSTPLRALRQYDTSVQPVVNAGYDFLHLSSGRDKVRPVASFSMHSF